ncbi:MAG: alanine racemase [Clostridia bacterium]|nr:alanine racemase [Clostridia bacterium]MBQ7046736.1 alanine racemase [Oscillospiraceae bacterium]
MMRYHRIYAKIDIDAIIHNLNECKRRIPEGTKVLAVIKADGYGHGAVELAKQLEAHTDYFGVAIIEEAVELRRSGIKNPILILGYTSPSQDKLLIEYDITQHVYTFEMAKRLSETAAEMGKPVKIHVGLDTGMSRVGFQDNDESIEIIKEISKLPNLCLEGIFSHYARADEHDKATAMLQSERFDSFMDKLEKAGVDIPIKHLSNSAAVVELDKHYDMVRFGISLYGLYPSEEVDKTSVELVPAMQIRSKIVNLKTVEAGCGVSYGHTFVTERPTRIATIPVGYADGYPRALSSQGRVIVNGQYAPIIGRVCMDQFMIDVTDINGELNIEDEVILMGSDNGCTVSAEEIGAMSASFNYEVVCNVARRVPRIYFKDGKPYKEISYVMNI